MWSLAGLIALALALFYVILNLPIPGLWKFALVVIEMAAVGQILMKYFGLTGEMGLIMLRSKRGLAIIADISRNEAFWKFFSDMGATMAYGLLSIPLMRGNTSPKSVVCGLVMLLLITLVVAPLVMPFMTQVLKIDVMEKAKASVSPVTSSFAPYALVLLLLGGLFILLLASLVMYGIVVLSAAAATILSGTNVLASTTPGATFLLPGVNLPFVEGIAALVIIMVVHEGAHAVLSRIGKIPLLSSGVVLFGIIPIGAFVEPDEAKLTKLEKVAQTRVLVAGSTANLVASTAFFILFVLFALIIRFGGLSDIPYVSVVAHSIYLILGMSFALNFVIGTVNLLPLPLFDGYRVIDVNLKNKNIVNGLMILTLLAFLMNFVPWFFVK
jgi:hypothetical protein